MSSTTTTASTVFIDLATFSELEGFLYGGPHAVTRFVASVQKANWFSYIPITLRHVAGTPDFGQQNVTASVNRSGDYVLHTWFSIVVPRIGLSGQLNANASIQWVRNLMHNIMYNTQILFNELIVEEFNNYWFDTNYQFRLASEKRVGYRNMIGDVASLIQPVGPNTPLGDGQRRSVPLPFWFSEDSGLALPVAALPFNDIKINYTFRRWQELVMINPGTGVAPATIANVVIFNDQGQATTQEPRFVDPQTWAHYAVVHNDERVKMGDAPRDMLIRQVQSAQVSPFKDVTSRTSFDLRFSHAIVHFSFYAENISLFEFGKGQYGREMSNYTTQSVLATLGPVNSAPDPLQFTQLLYENTPRIAMTTDYYSLINPYYFSTAIPDVSGYHFWSYALEPWNPTCPTASTNFSKLANVSIVHDASQAAVNASGLNGAPTGVDGAGVAVPLVFPPGSQVPFPQKWRHVLIASNWNIARVANGSLGHPTL